MHPDKGVEDPARRRVLHGCAVLVGKRRVLGLEGLTDTICSGRIHQQAHRHDHQERHDPFRLFEREGGGQKAWIFEEATSAFRVGVPFGALSELLGR